LYSNVLNTKRILFVFNDTTEERLSFLFRCNHGKKGVASERAAQKDSAEA
jgi:hypothetical protein